MLVLAGVLWGSEWTIAPLLRQVAGPFAAFASTSMLAAALLGAASLFTSKPAQPVHFFTTLALALALLAGPLALSIGASQHAIGDWPLLLFSLQPLLLGIATARWSAAMALAPGAVLVLLNGSVIFSSRILPSLFLAVAAMVLQAWAFQYAAQRLRGCSPGATLRSLSLALAAAALVLALASAVFDPAPRVAPWAQWGGTPLLAFGIVALFATAVPYALLWRVFAVGQLTATQIATVQWIQTLAALLEGTWFVRARPSLLMLAAVGVLAGCIAMELLRSPVEPSIALFDSHPPSRR